MKKLIRVTALILVLAICILTIAACGNTGDGSKKGHKVKLYRTDGVRIEGDYIKYVEDGGTAVFDVSVSAGYIFEYASNGVYDPIAGTLTVSNVTSDMHIDFCADEVFCTVSLDTSGGISVDGESRVPILQGGEASFKLVFPEGYIFASSNYGSYDYTTGILTVDNISSDITVSVQMQKDESRESFIYVFDKGYAGDTTSVLPGSSIPGYTSITVKATDESRIFVGWTAARPLSAGGELLCTDREYVFTMSNELATDNYLRLYSNYIDADTVYYDVNGGTVNTSSVNMSATKYYTATERDGVVTLVYGKKYLDFMQSASSFWDDGSFIRDGYILKEYNTAPDGSGTSYSLGSKVPLIDGSNKAPTLYCIWAKESNHADFEYSDYSLACPVNLSYAPNWVERGVVITDYHGNDDCVVIPDTLGGRTVIAVAAGAFENLDMTSLVMGRHMLRVMDGAFVGCSYLETVYFPDGIYEMNNEALDDASYTNLKNLYVNATLAPRFVGADTGALSVKLSRLMTYTEKPRVVAIAGSSSYQGLGSEYLEALLGGGYKVINFGTTRTTHGLMYLEAMAHYVNEKDIVLYAPENSSYMLGEQILYWKTLRDLENMNNIYRYVDISNYSNVFGAFTELNQQYRYMSSYTARSYEEICENGSLKNDAYLTGGYTSGTTNKYGDYLYNKRQGLAQNYIDTYYITMNEYVKSKDEGWWNNAEEQEKNKDYTDPNNKTWANVTDSYFADQMNFVISRVKSTGAKVYFSFCPVDSSALVDGASSLDWLLAYDRLILDTYEFDGIVGSSVDYVWDHTYFYDCAFHLNDYGRSFRTYRLYLDLCELLGIDNVVGFTSVGTDFDGCLFENGSDGAPLVKFEPIS